MNIETSPRTLSHGTLEVLDLQESTRFYRDFLGFNVSIQAPTVCTLSLQEGFVIVVLETGKVHEMSLVSHFGIGVASVAEVDRWHERVVSEQERYGISRVTAPRNLHGDYQFYLLDRDGNWWEFHHPIREA